MKFLAVKLPLIIIFLTCFVTIVEASEPSEIGNFYEPSEIVVQDEVRELFVNSAIKREMGKNELHVYSFRGESGKCLHLSVEQQGTDVIVTLVSPSNQTLAFVNQSILEQQIREVGGKGLRFFAQKLPQATVRMLGLNAARVGNTSH